MTISGEDKLQDLINKAPVSINCVDINGIIIWTNQAGLDYSGYTREEYIGKPIENFCWDFVDLILDKLRTQSIVKNVILKFIAKNGDNRDVLIDATKDVDNVIFTIRDDCLMEKERFLSKLIHDIKTPIHILKMSLSQLSRDNILQINKLDTIVSNIEHTIDFDDGRSIRLESDTLEKGNIGFFNTIEQEITVDRSSRRRVLLVEDNLICQKVCQALIMRCGHTCDVALNGKIALEIIDKDPTGFDIIFMDLRMPVMDGFEATESILNINRRLPIIALSAEEGGGIESKISDCGMTCFIQKPASSKQITDCILKYT